MDYYKLENFKRRFGKPKKMQNISGKCRIICKSKNTNIKLSHHQVNHSTRHNDYFFHILPFEPFLNALNL